jgi:hypothetical protein
VKRFMPNLQGRADYEGAAREPALWVGNALTLSRAAQLILPTALDALTRDRGGGGSEHRDAFLFGPYMLLSGMAVENLLKAIHLQRHPELVQDGRIVPRAWPGAPHGHDLVALMREVSASLATEHRDLLTRLTTFVLWGGRYPVPKDESTFVGQQRPRGPLLPREFRSSDPSTIGALLSTLQIFIVTETDDVA